MTTNTDKSSQTPERIQAMLQNLRIKLQHFTVFDCQGQLAGRVQDLVVGHDNHFNLVIASSLDPDHRLVLVSGAHIERVDSNAKAIYIDIYQADMAALPQYQPEDISLAESTQSAEVQSSPSPETQAGLNQMWDAENSGSGAETIEEQTIRLLEEELSVNRQKRKIGEVIVRKTIETRMVEVPVRREKLIVEQIGGTATRPLAEIDLGQGEVTGVELVERSTTPDGMFCAQGEFQTPKAALNLLDAIARMPEHHCHTIRLELFVDDEEAQKTYQDWFDQCRS